VKMSLLEDLNLKPHYIYETIVTTYSEDKLPNAAPMGIKLLNDRAVLISPFTSTRTFSNIEKTQNAVINFSYDLNIFYRSIYSVTSPKLPIEEFERATEVDAPRLKEALAYIETRVKDIVLVSQRARIIGEIITWNIGSYPLLPINRGFYLALECLIHSTRILEFQADQQKIQPLVSLIKQYKKLIDKVAPTGEYSIIVEQIQEMLGKKGLGT